MILSGPGIRGEVVAVYSFFSFYNLYDFFATIVPGAYVLFLTFLMLTASPYTGPTALVDLHPAFQVFLVMILVLLFGHLLHPLGNLVEAIMRVLKGWRHGAGQASLEDAKSLSAEFRQELGERIYGGLRIPMECREAFGLCYYYLRLRRQDFAAARLRALQGFYRQLAAASIVGFVAAMAAVGFVERSALFLSLAGGNAVLIVAMLYRYLRFTRLFVESVIRSYYVANLLGQCTSSPSAVGVSEATKGAVLSGVQRGEKLSGKKTLAIDLDGVLAEYHGWKGEEIVGKPMPGIRHFLQRIQEEGWELVIHTTRSPHVVVAWLEAQGLEKFFLLDAPSKGRQYRIVGRKPRATVYLDDRALEFTGDFDLVLAKLRGFKPHWKNDPVETES